MAIILDGTTGITTPDLIDSSLTSGRVVYAGASGNLTGSSALTYNGTDLQFASGSGLFINTSDGSDTGTLAIGGGGANSSARGGIVEFYGNENATAGVVDITSGNVANSYVRIQGRSSTSYVRFDINASEQMRLTSTGLGIGTSSPSASFKLDVTGLIRSNATANGGGQFTIAKSGTTVGVLCGSGNVIGSAATDLALYAETGNAVSIFTNGSATARATFDTSGNLGLGVTPSAWGGSIKALEGFSTSGSWSIASGGGLGSALNIQSNAYYDGSNWIYKSTSPAANYYQSAGTHVWRTAASGTAGNAISFTQAMTLDASGNLLVGTTSATAIGSNITSVNIAGSNGGGLVCKNNASSISYAYNDGVNNRFYITQNTAGVYLASGGTSWTSASDERVKDIIESISNAVTKVSTLRAVIGKYKTDEEEKRRSFLIAQDVQAVLPEAVDASNPDELGVQYTDVIPLLVAAIQEQQAIIESLKARLDAANL